MITVSAGLVFWENLFSWLTDSHLAVSSHGHISVDCRKGDSGASSSSYKERNYRGFFKAISPKNRHIGSLGQHVNLSGACIIQSTKPTQELVSYCKSNI